MLTCIQILMPFMTNAIYLTTTEPYSGKSIIALGLMNLLASKTEKIAYFKPVISSDRNEKDNHLHTIASHFNLSIKYEDMFVFTRSEAVKYMNTNQEAYFIDTIIDKFKKLQEPIIILAAALLGILLKTFLLG